MDARTLCEGFHTLVRASQSRIRIGSLASHVRPLQEEILLTKILIPAIAVALIAGCAAQQQTAWVRAWPGGNSLQQDSAQCDYETSAATQTTDYGFKTMFGQELDRAVRKNDLAVQCMRAKGWTRVAIPHQGATTDAGPFAEAAKLLRAENEAMCIRPNLRPIFAKSACDAAQITQFQISDASTINDYEKALFSEWRTQVASLNLRANQATRTYAGPRGDRMASANEASNAKLDQASAALLAGQMTWGQFNFQRRDLSLSLKAETSAIASAR